MDIQEAEFVESEGGLEMLYMVWWYLLFTMEGVLACTLDVYVVIEYLDRQTECLSEGQCCHRCLSELILFQIILHAENGYRFRCGAYIIIKLTP